jgi:hypothetical protein
MSNRHLDERIERLCQIEKKLGDIDQLTDLSLWRKTFKTLVAEGASVFCELDQFCWWCTTETTSIAAELLHIFSLANSSSTEYFKSVCQKQLQRCFACVLNYHQIKVTLRQR